MNNACCGYRRMVSACRKCCYGRWSIIWGLGMTRVTRLVASGLFQYNYICNQLCIAHCSACQRPTCGKKRPEVGRWRRGWGQLAKRCWDNSATEANQSSGGGKNNKSETMDKQACFAWVSHSDAIMNLRINGRYFKNKSSLTTAPITFPDYSVLELLG